MKLTKRIKDEADSIVNVDDLNRVGHLTGLAYKIAKKHLEMFGFYTCTIFIAGYSAGIKTLFVYYK